ncbi:MAG: 23S rRNA (pseudouridine(1915)-N(3))-methyltransferase RlmH [Tissierellia bacterium]|nr:23S rRNA (pseudouridine(1915)-N(3))-methyltransferase RlmH [Tissierellia bacterium]
MQYKILCVGKIKDQALSALIDDYVHRMRAYVPVEIVEVKDEPSPASASQKDEERVKMVEGQRLLEKIHDGDLVLALDLTGKELDSVALSQRLYRALEETHRDVVLLIGGSLGLSSEVLKRAQGRISFSKLTFPHQLMRLILLEQLYRSARIHEGHAYHK